MLENVKLENFSQSRSYRKSPSFNRGRGIFHYSNRCGGGTQGIPKTFISETKPIHIIIHTYFMFPTSMPIYIYLFINILSSYRNKIIESDECKIKM